MLCSRCQREIIRCEYPGCVLGTNSEPAEAEYEAWFGEGRVTRLRICPEHAKLSRAYQAKGEAVFAEAASGADLGGRPGESHDS